MGKHRAQRLIEVDGVFYRRRRGKLVPIPARWVGATAHPQTIDKRTSKLPRKVRTALGHGRNPRRLAPRHSRRLRETLDHDRRFFSVEQRERCHALTPRRGAAAEWQRDVYLYGVRIELLPPVRGDEFAFDLLEAAEVEEFAAYAGLYDSEEEILVAVEAQREEDRRNWEEWQYEGDDT